MSDNKNYYVISNGIPFLSKGMILASAIRVSPYDNDKYMVFHDTYMDDHTKKKGTIFEFAINISYLERMGYIKEI